MYGHTMAYLAVCGRNPEALVGAFSRGDSDRLRRYAQIFQEIGEGWPCFEFSYTSDNGGGEVARSRFGGLKVQRWIDDISPLIARALCDQSVVRLLVVHGNEWGTPNLNNIRPALYLHLRGQIVDQHMVVAKNSDYNDARSPPKQTLPREEVTFVPTALDVMTGDRKIRHFHPDPWPAGVNSLDRAIALSNDDFNPLVGYRG